MRASDHYYQLTGRNGLYNIQHIGNLTSIINHGLLSHDKARRFGHVSIAMDEIQRRRNSVKVPNGLWLHQYASLYFDYRNPMLSKRRDKNDEICILKVDASVLDIEGVVVSDRNASCNYVMFDSPEEGLEKIRFDLVFAKYWSSHDDEYYEIANKKAIKCAEVLVPHSIPYDYVLGAAVYSDRGADVLADMGFNRAVIVEPRMFF